MNRFSEVIEYWDSLSQEEKVKVFIGLDIAPEASLLKATYLYLPHRTRKKLSLMWVSKWRFSVAGIELKRKKVINDENRNNKNKGI